MHTLAGVFLLLQTADALVADIGAMEAVGHADFVNGLVGFGLSFRQRFAESGHAENAAAVGLADAVFDDRAAVEDLGPVGFGFVQPFNGHALGIGLG